MFVVVCRCATACVVCTCVFGLHVNSNLLPIFLSFSAQPKVPDDFNTLCFLFSFFNHDFGLILTAAPAQILHTKLMGMLNAREVLLPDLLLSCLWATSHSLVFLSCSSLERSVLPAALLAAASSLRDRAAFFQSETLRPANDPEERDPAHVRMLNDVLRDLEKSFINSESAPGVYRWEL